MVFSCPALVLWSAVCITPAKSIMKTLGIVLIIAGILMLVYRGFSVTTEKKVVDLGPVEVNKKENKWIGWPVYAGGIAIVAGVFFILGDRKKT
jgi:predicted membrane protein